MDNAAAVKEADVRFGGPYDRCPRFWIVLSGSTQADRKNMAAYRPWLTDGYPCRDQYSRDFSVEYITAHGPAWTITVRTAVKLRDAADRLRSLGFSVTGPSASFIKRWFEARRRLDRQKKKEERQ